MKVGHTIQVLKQHGLKKRGMARQLVICRQPGRPPRHSLSLPSKGLTGAAVRAGGCDRCYSS